ncbi:DUF637 domain-containing protein [Marinagarivorans algicola]|uniref:DUF637 domain-containing protein n=1 Tax=Marinagarivorans algicola TaxID=1513270 RepID=UPI0037369D77
MIFLTARPAKIMKPFRLNLFIKQCVAYALSFLLVFGSSAPSIADILTSQSVEHSLAKNPVYINEPTSDYMYRTPAFVEWPTSRSKSLASMYDQLLTEDSTTIGEAQFVPIGVGDITTFIPTYPKYQYIGTPPVQARYVRTQIMALLGRNLIDGEDSRYATEAKQLDTLFSQAIAYAKNTDYRYGDVLNLDQEASGLSQDMIWPELRVVNGKSVIVPVVYLTRETVNNRRVIDSEAQLPKTTTIGQLNVVNTDIRFARDTLLEVTDLLATNSTITGTGNLKIVAEGNFDNASSIIETNCTDKQGRQLELGAGSCDLTIGAKNIKNHTIVYRYDLEHEQGSHYGQIAKLASHGGNVVLTALENIEFNGADATALNGAITLTAEGDIRIGTQELYSGSKSRYGSGSATTYLQSHLTAEDTISLIAGGLIAVNAAELISEKGHIELLAGMGIYVENAYGVVQEKMHSKIGKTTRDMSQYQTFAIQANLKAGKGIHLNTESGPIVLRAVDINAGEGTVLNAQGLPTDIPEVAEKNGQIHLLMAKEQDKYSYSKIKKSLLTIKTTTESWDKDTPVYTTIVGGLEVNATRGVVVEYGGKKGATEREQVEAIAELTGMAGMDWFADLQSQDCANLHSSWSDELSVEERLALMAQESCVDFGYVGLADTYSYDRSTNLSPAAMAIISIAVIVATGGVGSAFLSGSLASSGIATAVANAAFTTMVTQAATTAATASLNGDYSPYAVIREMGTKDSMRSLATAMVTAGAMAAANDVMGFADATTGLHEGGFFSAGADSLNFADQSLQILTQTTISSAVNVLAEGGSLSDFGGDFEDQFKVMLISNAANAIGQSMANGITDSVADGAFGTALEYVGHAAVGCLVGVASNNGAQDQDQSGDCSDGAFGAVSAHLVSDVYELAKKDEVVQLLQGEQTYMRGRLGDGVPKSALRAETATSVNRNRSLINDIRRTGADLARLSAAVGALLAGADVNIAANSGTISASASLREMAISVSAALDDAIKEDQATKIVPAITPKMAAIDLDYQMQQLAELVEKYNLKRSEDGVWYVEDEFGMLRAIEASEQLVGLLEVQYENYKRANKQAHLADIAEQEAQDFKERLSETFKDGLFNALNIEAEFLVVEQEGTNPLPVRSPDELAQLVHEGSYLAFMIANGYSFTGTAVIVFLELLNPQWAAPEDLVMTSAAMEQLVGSLHEETGASLDDIGAVLTTIEVAGAIVGSKREIVGLGHDVGGYFTRLYREYKEGGHALPEGFTSISNTGVGADIDTTSLPEGHRWVTDPDGNSVIVNSRNQVIPEELYVLRNLPSNPARGTHEYELINNPLPNTRVELDNGTTFQTNEGGFVEEITYTPELSTGKRDARQTAVGHEGLSSDAGGHIQACRLGGSCHRFNLFPQDSNFNNGIYKSWEYKIYKAIKNNQEIGPITVRFERSHPDNVRPDNLIIDYFIDGEAIRLDFKNAPGGGL